MSYVKKIYEIYERIMFFHYSLNHKYMLSAFQKITRYFTSWLGKKVDYDKAYGNQCVDWAREFARSSTMNPIGTFSGSAINGWTTGSPFKGTRWKRVEYKK